MKLLTVFIVGVIAALSNGVASGAGIPCATCHSETANSFANQSHGRALAQAGDAACESCHGDGSAHVTAPATAGPMIKFHDEPAARIAEACGSCHKDVHASSGGAHVQAGLACNSCHAVHQDDSMKPPAATGKWRKLDAASTTCATCHQDIFSQFNFNEGHRLAEGSVSCISCHDPHAPDTGTRLGSFKHSACSTCHADKDGPFVFEHAASRVEGCGACHTAHGSPNRHMLTHQQTGALCYTCHAGVPQFHIGFSPAAPPRFDERTVCTNCHVTIHGSNLDRNFLR